MQGVIRLKVLTRFNGWDEALGFLVLVKSPEFRGCISGLNFQIFKMGNWINVQFENVWVRNRAEFSRKSQEKILKF
jgi:hypothetical protein